MAHRLAQVSDALQGRYVIERELGRGGMATVYLASDLRHDRRVALKLLDEELATTVGSERFLREIRLAGRLSHPHILAVFDSGTAAGRLWYAMPYVDGQSLRERLRHESQLRVADAVRIAGQIAGALDHAHERGIVHRDIKPENILFAGDEALVADFGIAKALDGSGDEKLTATGLSLGTPAYMSPEQAAGGPADVRSDVYALGCVVYEMLAGAPPFTGPNAQSILARHAVDPVPPLRTVRSTVPDAVEAAVERALAKVPADRYATAGEFAAALVAEGAASKPSRRANRLRKGLALGTTVAMVLAGIGALALRRTASSTVLPSASSIAVIPFRSADDDTALARLGRDLAITVSASLDGVGGIATTDRLRVAHETAERRMKSPEDAAALARRLNARSVLVGTMVRDGNGVRLDLGLYDAQDLEPLARGITVTGHRDSLTALTDSVVWAVLRQVWQRGKLPTPSLAAVTSKSLPALRAFLDGEQYVENDEWDAAVLAYRSAFTADSTFWLAYFRYSFAQYWGGHQTEPEISDAFYRHRHVLPERDRLLIEGWSISDSLSLELERYREITRRFPDYWPAWFLLGDRLFHVGILLGYDWKDVQSALGRAVALNRHLTPAWLHLFGNTVGKDTVESARMLAHGSDVPLLRGPVLRLLHDVARSGGVISEGTSALADSVAKARAANSDEFPAITWILLGRGFPAAQIQFNSRLHRMETEPRKVASQLRGSAWSWAARGAWDSGLVAIHEAVRAEPRAPSERGPTALTEYGMAVLGAWLGTLPASEAVVRRAPAQALVGGLEEGPGKRESLSELAWLDGVLGFTQQDRTAVERARERARRSGYPYSGIIDTSLAAFSKALSGNRAGAGRDLAALEWRCVNRWDCGGTVTPNIAIHRLVAARWLLEDGDTAQAGRLLTWHEAESSLLESSFTYAVSPLAYLLLARIEDAQGDTRSASEHYQQFLRRYDMPMPAQRHLVDEARAALSRLSGRGDPAAIR